MNQKIPRTPFSTALSGSAKETEIRLKNIFSGPKKRPPALFLALMFSLCVFCGNLVSCQVAEAEAPDVSEDISPAVAQQTGDWQPVRLENSIHAESRLVEPFDFFNGEEIALLQNLPADQLPPEAVDLHPDPMRRDYWQDLLLPAAADGTHDVTVYFVTAPNTMPNMDPMASPLLWGGELLRVGIVLRQGNRTAYFPLCWEGNAHYNSNPTLLVDDLDGNDRPEAALVLCLGGGTGAYEENLYIFDLDTMTYTVPDYSEIPLEITVSPDGKTARLVSGNQELEVDISGLEDRFEGRIEVGNIIRFRQEDGRILCVLDIDFTCHTLEYMAEAEFPVIYENGAYRLGPAVSLSETLYG